MACVVVRMQTTGQCLSDMVPAGLEQQFRLEPRPETAGMPVVACAAAGMQTMGHPT